MSAAVAGVVQAMASCAMCDTSTFLPQAKAKFLNSSREPSAMPRNIA